MGLNAGPVPARVEANLKAAICDMVTHATDHGYSARWACQILDVDPSRVARWQTRKSQGVSLDDALPGGNPVHGILEWERQAVLELYERWGEVDRSHRKLAHRGSRLELVHVSPSTVQRVLLDNGMILPGTPPREPVARTPWPEWLVWEPCQIWAYDFTHFTRAKRAVIAIIDVVTRKWVSTVSSPEESSTQVESAFIQALEAEGLWEAGTQAASDELVCALVSGDEEKIDEVIKDGDKPLLLTISDNGPQMTSHTTRDFLAGVAIAQRFGRPGTPQDQAWIETLFGHIKTEWPYLEHIRDGAELDAELQVVREHYNTVRLSAAVGYVTPDDEHHGRGPAIRQARKDGLIQARQLRMEYRRNLQATHA